MFALLACLALTYAMHATQALAAETLGAGHAAHQLTYPDGAPFTCPGWSGGSDGSGAMYIPCGGWIYELAPDGSYRGAIQVPAGYNAARDVAASKDGSTLYFTSGPHGGMDRPNPVTDPTVGKVVRLVRDASGAFIHDTGWNVGPFLLAEGHWSARNVDVDLNGRVYVTANAYVFIYDPTTGQRIGAFGSDHRYDGTRYLEGLEIAQGIAASRDGRSVYVVEQRWNHVQRWDLDAAGAWRRSTSWRLGALGSASDCVDNGTFASPYDVGLDGAGNVYVLDTSCRRIQKYAAGTGEFLGSVWRNYPVGEGEQLYHGFTVNWQGNLVVGDQGRRYVLAAQQPGCGPDGDAPAITRLRHPAVVGADHRLVLDVQATDACSYAAELEVTGAATTAGWGPYRQAVVLTIPPGDGVKHFTLKVRDPYGHTTSRDFSVRLDSTIPAFAPRHRIAVAGASRLCSLGGTATLRGTGYRLLDACATYSGRVRSLRRRGSTLYLQLTIDQGLASRLYVGTTGPVEIWVVGSLRKRPGKPLRVGRQATVTSALGIARGAKSVSGVPVYSWSGL